VNDRKYAPEEIAAIILRKLRTEAEIFLDETITKAVIAVPSNFNLSQRQAIKNAGRIAGLEVLRLIDATSAAALSYGFKKEDNETIMVCDIGGSTTDVSILELGDGVYEVKATNGNNCLGGVDFDERIVDWMADEFYQIHGVNLKNDKIATGRLKEAAEKVKIELSTVAQTEIKIPFIRIMADEQQHLEVSLTRKKFEELTSDLIRNALVPIEKVIKDANISSNELDKVLLIGGSTKIPALHEAIEKLVGDKVCKRYNSDECVVKGAAMSAGVLSGDIVDVLLLNALNLSLGIETTGGVFTRLIDRNTTIPTKKSQVFSTDIDNQTIFEVHVLQGEREMAKDNITLDRFQLTGIPAARRGVPQIEVTVDIDANGIINVSAKDLGTGKSGNKVVKPKTNMSEDGVYQAVIEVDEYY
jgi:molecular chaperone DnaK